MYHTILKIDFYSDFWANRILIIIIHLQYKFFEVFWNLKASVESHTSRETEEVMGEVRELGSAFS